MALFKARRRGLKTWRDLLSDIERMHGVVAVSPYITEKAILGTDLSAAWCCVDRHRPSNLKATCQAWSAAMTAGDLQSLDAGAFNVVLGAALGQHFEGECWRLCRCHGASADRYPAGDVPAQ